MQLASWQLRSNSPKTSVCPSEAWNTLFWPVHGSVGPPDQPWPFYSMSVRPSIRSSVCRSVRRGFRAFAGERMEEMAWNVSRWCILTTFRTVHGHGLLIFVILALFWLSEMGQIWGFRAISWRTHGGNGLKYCMLLYPDHLQNWLDYGYGLVIF